MQCHVMVMNEFGVWITDSTRPKEQALDRARFLIPRVPAVKVLDNQGERHYL